MNTRLTLIIAVIMSIIAIVYLLDIKNTTKKTEEKYENSRVFTSDYEHTDSFSIFRNSELLSFEKKDGIWYMVSPENHIAQESEMESILNIMLNLSIDEVIDKNPSDLTEFGLKPPSMILILKSGEKEQTVLTGVKNYSQSSYFAKRDNSPEVFTISNIGLSNFEAPYENFISGSAIAINPINVNKIYIKSNKSSIELSKEYSSDDIYKWNIVSPKVKNADKDKVEDFLWSLKNTKVDKNHGKAINQDELKQNCVVEILFKQKDMPDEVLYVNKVEKGFYSCLSGITGNLSEIKKENLDEIIPNSYNDFEDFHLLKQPLSEFSKIEINNKNKKYLIKRDRKKSWILDGKPDSHAVLNGLLMNLQALEYDPNKTSSEKSELYLSIHFIGKKNSTDIKIYKSGTNYFTNLSGTFYAVSADKLIESIQSIEK